MTRFSLPLRPSPTPRCHTTPSFRPPSRYPPPNRLTAPRCGIHGGARVGTPSTTDPLDVRAVPTAVTPPWIPVFTGKTRWQPSFRPPSRYPPPNRLTAPRCGIHGRARVGTPSTTDPLDVRAVPTAVTPPWIPASAGKTRWQPSFRPPSRYPPPNRLTAPRCGIHGGARVGTPSTTDPLDVRAVPTAVTPPRFSPVRRGGSRLYRPPSRTHPSLPARPPKPVPTPQPSYRTPMRYPRWGPGGDPFDYRPARRWRSPHRRHTTMDTGVRPRWQPSYPHPDPVPTPQPSYRTPMRYPWWGPGGDPFDYRPARRKGSPHRRHTTMDTGFHR